MHISNIIVLGTSVATTAAVFQGFNYGSTNTDGSAIGEDQYRSEFATAQQLVGTSGFSSARLYTMIQGGTSNTPTEAIPAAINTTTSLLLGIWASAGEANIDNEIATFQTAISTYGTAFTDLIVGVSVGSEDLYRISPTGIENLSGVGASPDDIVSYIGKVKNAIASTSAKGILVGHVDTWTAWVNGSNDAVIGASDFIGMDAYPYFQNTMANSIDNAYSLFFDAYDQTLSAAGNKPVWVTETGYASSFLYKRRHANLYFIAGRSQDPKRIRHSQIHRMPRPTGIRLDAIDCLERSIRGGILFKTTFRPRQVQALASWGIH